MADETSVNDIFRFIHLRPRRTVPESRPIPLVSETALAKRLSTAGTVSKRGEIANAALSSSPIQSVADVPLGREITAAVRLLQPQRDATIEDLRQRLPTLDETRGDRGFRAQLEALSDLLLASFFATAGFPAHLDRLQDVYRVYHVPAADDQGLLEPLTQALARPLLAPRIARRDESPTPPSAGNKPATLAQRDALAGVIHQLAQLDRRELLVQPDEEGSARPGSTPFTLTAAARKLVSAEASAVLKARGIDLSVTPIDIAVQSLFAAKLALPVKGLNWPRPVVVPISGQAQGGVPRRVPAGPQEAPVVARELVLP